jgi:hypothetical protein
MMDSMVSTVLTKFEIWIKFSGTDFSSLEGAYSRRICEAGMCSASLDAKRSVALLLGAEAKI